MPYWLVGMFTSFLSPIPMGNVDDDVDGDDGDDDVGDYGDGNGKAVGREEKCFACQLGYLYTSPGQS